MKEYLELLAIPLGALVQVMRGNGVPTKVLLPATLVVCAIGVWLGAPDDASFKSVARDGLIWIIATVGGMFGTAFGAYKIAAQGKNQEERAKIAASPFVPVTDPTKEIHK